MSAADAAERDLEEGDLVEVASARGALRARLRITDIRRGLLFVPFHYGYWDTPAGYGPAAGSPGRAANETTNTDWDPASKQPLFKTASAALTLVERAAGTPAPAPTTTASAPARQDSAPPTTGGRTAHATHTLGAEQHGRKGDRRPRPSPRPSPGRSRRPDPHPCGPYQMRWTNTMIKNLSPQLLTSL